MLLLFLRYDPKVHKILMLPKRWHEFKPPSRGKDFHLWRDFKLSSYLLCSPREKIWNSCNLISVILCKVPSLSEFWSDSGVTVRHCQPCTIPALLVLWRSSIGQIGAYFSPLPPLVVRVYLARYSGLLLHVNFT